MAEPNTHPAPTTHPPAVAPMPPSPPPSPPPSAASAAIVALPGQTLARVFAVMERLAASNDLKEILSLIIDSMRDGLRAERASVFQFDVKAQELFITQAHGAVSFRFPITKGIAGEAARTQRIINVPDAWDDPRFNNEFDKKSGFRTRALLTIPLLSYDGGLEGVAQVLNKAGPGGGGAGSGGSDFCGVFDADDEMFARALASQAAIAIRRARLIDAERRKNKIEGDLAVARTIQMSSLPKQLPQIAGYDIAATTVPAEETGGDTYDLIDVSTLSHQPTISAGGGGGPIAGPGGGRVDGTGSAVPARRGLFMLIADATGHGIGPAISVTQAKSMIRMGIRLGAGIEQITEHLNAQLCDDLPMGRFITAFIGLLDPDKHTITWSSPGQAPLILVRADGSYEEFSANALPLGIDADLRPDPVEPMCMNPGDVFLLLSDGYLEAMAPDNSQFGMDRTMQAVRSSMHGTAADILAAINQATKEFARGRPFGDDQTAVIVKRMA